MVHKDNQKFRDALKRLRNAISELREANDALRLAMDETPHGPGELCCAIVTRASELAFMAYEWLRR